MKKKYIHGTSKGEQKRLSKLNEITNEEFVKYIGDCSNKSVCDFGCGLGIMVNELAKKYPSSNLTGIEISKDHFNVAQEINKQQSNTRVINTDALFSEIEDNTFDITYCRYFLEHVSDPVEMVSEMRRVTKPGGKIICQENDLYNVILHPPIEGYDKLRSAFCELQLKMGGDPFIGRKLFDIFNKAKVKEIELSYAPEVYTQDDDTFIHWLENMLNILKVAEGMVIKSGHATIDELEKLYGLIEERIEKPVGASYFHWNRVTAVK